MSVSEHPRPITIRYIARNNSNKSESSPPNKSFFFTSLNPINQDQEPGTHFITLQDTSRDDAFDSANEADEEDNPPTEQSSQNHQYNSDFADNIVEEVAMECRFVRAEPSLVFDPSSSDSKTACIAADQQPEAFQLTLNSSLSHLSQLSRRYHSLPFFRIRVIIGSFLIVAAFILPSFLTGLFTGIYLSMIVFLLLCVSEPMAKSNKNEEVNGEILRKLVAKRSMQEKHGKIYKGWMNILNEHYHPHTFHVNTIQTVLVRLDGNMLRISRPEKAMLKHCFYNDPTLTEPEPRMVMQNIYDLTGATIKLRPRRLARRRWFSRKYPICIKLAKNDDNSAYGSSTTNTGLRDRKAARTMNVESVSQQSDETSKSPTPDQEQNTFPRSKKMATRMSESDDETTDLTTEEEELPIRHSISDFTLGSSGRRLRAKKRQPDRYIFLFARSAREKERWFHKLRKSCYKYNKPTKASETTVSHEDRRSASKRCHSFDALEEIAKKMTKQYMLYSLQEFQFAKQLELLFGQMHETSTWCEEPSEGTIEMDLGLNKWNQPGPEDTVSDQFVVLVNLIATRVFYDFCRDEYWCDAVRNKIQTKLATIHLPYFIETLELSTFDLGTSIPKINKVYRPCVDEWGIWCDFEIKYSGLIKLGLETRVNLMKLKSVGESSDEQQLNSENMAGPACPYSTSILRTTPSRYSDEEMPESPETSPDEEFGAKLKEFTSRRQKTGQKILSLVDRLAHSKYFREAADLKPIRKMMEEISSTRLMLNVEVTELEGIMTCNFPPPPSDRLWYGFRQSPKMSMRAIPQVGDRSVVYSALSEWIENKLQLILEKNLVLPNMDDVVIPIMSGNQLLQGNLNG